MEFYGVMNSKFFLSIIAIVFTFALVANFNDASAITIGNSETILLENQYSFGLGILEYRQLDGGSCMFNIPNYKVTSVNSSKNTLLNLDGFSHNFFAVIANHNDTSYQYLQIGLPSGSGYPSYLLDLKNETKKLRGEFYHDYENMAVLIESDRMASSLSDESYKRFFTDTSKDITHSRHTFEPGEYNFGAMLFKSHKPNWVGNEECVIRVDWQFTINQDGRAIVDEPTVNVGKLFDVTEEFAPLAQHKAGVSAIDCKSGLRLIHKATGDSEKTPACVTPDTQKKLIARGWAEQSGNTGKQSSESLESDYNHELIELFKNIPEVKAFHMQYQDAQTSLRDDHISYFSGSEDGYLVRMNMFFDENYEIENVDFHCYYKKVHQFEFADSLTSKIEKYDCKEYAESKNKN